MRTTQRFSTAAVVVGICTMALGATVPAVGAATVRAHGHHTPPAGPTLTIGTTPLSAATVGTPYSATLTVTGATGTVTWSPADHSNLPRGLQLNPATGVLAGTPRVAGTAQFSVSVRQNGTTSSASATLALVVNAAPQVSVTSATLPQPRLARPTAPRCKSREARPRTTSPSRVASSLRASGSARTAPLLARRATLAPTPSRSELATVGRPPRLRRSQSWSLVALPPRSLEMF